MQQSPKCSKVQKPTEAMAAPLNTLFLLLSAPLTDSDGESEAACFPESAGPLG